MFVWTSILFSALLFYQASADPDATPAANAATRPPLLGQPCAEEKKFMVIFMNAKTNKVICAGTLINSEYVMTAAHCSAAWMDQHVHLVAGVSRQDLKELERVHIRATESLYTHPNYFLMSHDIMLVKLIKPVDEAHNVDYVKLPWGSTGNLETTCANPLLIGWSMGSDNVSPDDLKLLCANLKLYPFDKCKADYTKYPDFKLDDEMMCTKTDILDACYGDAGAPLMCGDVQYGVVTWGIGCADELPGVYTRVDLHLEFIKDVLEGNIEPRLPAGRAEGLRGGVGVIFGIAVTFLYTFVNY